MAKKSGSGIVNGTIDTESIYAAHSQIKEIVESYKNVNLEVSRITQKVKENWVGKGSNEFESQYKLLITKIDDFGEALKEIYDALVQSEADYETLDDQMRQQLVMAMEK